MGQFQETSAGAIIYTVKNGDILFLLVYSAKNLQWGFPKGHIEEGETEIQAAKREIFEETGISELEFAGNFKCTDSYKTKGVLPHTLGSIITKNVIYYLCRAQSDFVDRNNGEIEKCGWFDFESATKVLKYSAQKLMLKKAKDFLQGGKNESCIKQ
ncbi:MAG: NUDIX domain-containing protein [Endomicrobiaceae bacterium]|nr:NUDIX domain-containing protein [Endomicrobiaceae bacterium]MDD4165695.1 NUDIX domain-containing protein [Endomicrobiaceae bacterium]